MNTGIESELLHNILKPVRFGMPPGYKKKLLLQSATSGILVHFGKSSVSFDLRSFASS